MPVIIELDWIYENSQNKYLLYDQNDKTTFNDIKSHDVVIKTI